MKLFIGHPLPSVATTFFGRGFSLVELLVTLTVAGILLALAVPSMATFLQSNRLTTATNNLMADMQLARTEAIKRGVQAAVCKSADGSTCSTSTSVSWAAGWLVFVDADNSGTWTAGTDLRLRVQEALPDDLTLTVNPSGTNVLVFTRRGLVFQNKGKGTYKLCSVPLDRARVIDVSATGRPNLSEAPSC